MPHQLVEPWIERTTEALDLLSARLDDPPSLQELADAAGCSAFHFHRIWRALLGETVGQTIARLRVAAAQQRLSDRETSITRVAMDGGFATPQSFARAFRRVAGLSPSEFAAGDHAPSGVAASLSAEVRVELRAPCTLVALRREGGAYRQLNALFTQLWMWAEASGNLPKLERIYGFPIDDPLSVPEDQLRYDACLALGDDVDPPSPFRRLMLPAGEYACLHHLGSYDDFEGVDQALIEWAITAGRRPADLPLFHHFFDDPEATPVEQLRADALLLLEPVSGLTEVGQ